MRASVGFAVVGVLVLATLLATNNPGEIVRAIGSIGATGFAVLLAWQCLLYLPLGAAWTCLGRRLPLRATVWARAVRDGAVNCLPFNVIGGVVFGSRALERGAPCTRSEAVITNFVDLTLEFAAQIVFAMIGISLLLWHRPDASVLWPMLASIPVLVVLAGAAILFQTGARKPIRALSARIGRPYFEKFGLDGDLDALFDHAYRRPSALAANLLLHLMAWIGLAVACWLSFRLLAIPVSFPAALAIEGGLSLARAASFVVPAGLGVQEAAYIGLSALYGVPAEAALAVSLLRRARELALGIPILLADQWRPRPNDGHRLLDRHDWWARTILLIDRVLDWGRYGSGKPSAEAALKAVANEPGRQALDDPELREAMEQWARALREEANLNALGRISAQWDMVRLLRIRCRMAAEEEMDPTILDEQITAPLFITGMPRSGSTFLHAVLAQDEDNLVPRCWQGLEPYPPRSGRDRREVDAQRQLEMFMRLSPGLSSVHLLASDAPQECSELMAASFRSFRFESTHRVPGYRHWMERADHRPGYAFLRRLLQHLQRQTGPGRWMLKCPDHVFALDALLETFPDARFVVMHRDPLKILPSNTKLIELLRRPFTRSIDRIELGRDEMQDWLDGARRIIELDERIPADRLVHVHYRDFTASPLATIETIYDRFGMPLRESERAKIARLCAKPGGGYGRNQYRFADHGIDPAVERERFRFYTEHFGVEEEVSLFDPGEHRDRPHDSPPPLVTGRLSPLGPS